MKLHSTLALLLFLCVTSVVKGQQAAVEEPREFEMQEGDTTFVMKRYVMVMLLAGDNAGDFTEQELEDLQAAHLANINRLAEEGIIAIAGPFGDDTPLRGIFILDVGSVEEAKTYVDTDPMIEVGRLKAEYHPWWAAKGSILP